MSIQEQDVDQSLLATMTADERAAYLESLNDPEMQGAIEDVANMSDEELKSALAGKDDAGNVEAGDLNEKPATSTESQQTDSQEASVSQPEQEEQFKPVLRADVPPNIEQIKADLQAKRAELSRKVREGEIDFDEYETQVQVIDDQREQIRATELTAHIYADQQKQTAEQEWQFNLRQMMKAAKRDDGVDYNASPKMLKDLDLMLKGLANDPDNADKDADYFLNEAHRRVLALNGIAKTAARPDPVASRKAPTAAIPPSIGDLPGGGDESDLGGGEFSHLEKLTGEAFERAFGRLTEDQRRRYLEA